MLVVLRLCLGCHFLYEGVWKIKHSDEFSAEPFLTQAKGPMAGLFYAMVPDLYGRQRLKIVESQQQGKTVKQFDIEPLRNRWEQYREEFLSFYEPGRGADEDARAAFEKLKKQTQLVLEEHCQSAAAYLNSQLEDIEAYFGALERFENDKEAHQGAPFQKQRRWNQMFKLRAQAAGWIAELEGREAVFKSALQECLPKSWADEKGPPPHSRNPLRWNRIEQINFAVTYGLTAIGLCLLLGLFTRLAALGGALFMLFVIMTQPAWPTIFPPDPPVVGHALLINKDFIEMVALLLVASSAVGRWGGLDYLVHHLIVDPFLSKRINKTGQVGNQAQR